MICTHCKREVSYIDYSSMLTTREKQTAFEEAIIPFCNAGGDHNLFEVPTCPACYVPAGWLTYVTTAPEAYDGFGTKTIGEADTEYGPARVVLIDPAAERWQTCRYSSGLKLGKLLSKAQEEENIIGAVRYHG